MICGGSRGKIIDEVMQYYAETPLPTNGIDKAVGGWLVSAPSFGTTSPSRSTNVPTSTAHSQLCHASLSQWTMTTGVADGSTQQKDRCAKACYDMVLKTTTLLNAYFARQRNAVPAGIARPQHRFLPGRLPLERQGQDGLRFVPRRDRHRPARPLIGETNC